MARHWGHDSRVWVIAIFIIGLFAGLLGRLCVIQGMDVHRYRSLAERQHFATVPRSAPRGSVLDVRGRPLAISVRADSVFVDPRLVENPVHTARRLRDLLGVDAEALEARIVRRREEACVASGLSARQVRLLRALPALKALGESARIEDGTLVVETAAVPHTKALAEALAPILAREPSEVGRALEARLCFAWVKRKVTEAERKLVVGAGGLDGVGVVGEYRRVYPHGDLAAQVIGFAGVDEQGLEGLEKVLDGELAGTLGCEKIERDAAGRWISRGSTLRQSAQRGADVELSIDIVIQGYVEAALREACDLWAPEGAFAIALEPATGDVVAAASLPTFDPNDYQAFEPEELRNRARARYIVDWMEPGSIMKPFVFSGALTEKIVSEQSPISCENGVWLIGGRRFHDHHAYGNLTAAEVIIKSSNIGAAKIGTRLGMARLHRYLTRFGFGQATGFDLPGENPGLLRPVDRWTSYSLPSISVGQEICVNSLQMACAYGAIANDGVRMHPRLVRRVRRPDGTWLERPSCAARRVIPAQVARRVRRVLLRTVEEGTGKRSRIASYSVGGKTGTAQRPSRTGGFSHTELICSFVGMAPIERPRLVVIVSLDRPRKHTGGRHFGGTVAAPVVGQILKQSLAYLGIEPDKPAVLARWGLADARGKGNR